MFANGYTKDKIMKRIKKYNNGKCAIKVRTTGTVCQYQTDDGNRCAIGCFIPKGHAGLKHNGPVSDLLFRYPDLVGKMPFKGVQVLDEFQLLHDNCVDGNVHQAIEKWLDNKVKE